MDDRVHAPGSSVSSGHPATDRYLAERFERVRGMSSRFSAAICARIVHRQPRIGVKGPIAEIGAFEGRFLIPLALGLGPGERAYAIDTFDWPDKRVEERFLEHCRAAGLARGQVVAVKRDSTSLTASELDTLIDGEPVRFFHIDGDHKPDSLAHDLALAHAALHPEGVIGVDDMLHPEFPLLAAVVHAYLRAHREMRLFCVIDREDIVAAAKFLICRAEAVSLYEDDLMTHFAAAHYTLGGDALGHLCVVLTPNPRIFLFDEP